MMENCREKNLVEKVKIFISDFMFYEQPLSIHSAYRDPPVVGIISSELRYVGGNIASSDVSTLFIDPVNRCTELIKLWKNELILESLGYNLKVLFHNPAKENI